MQDSQSTLTKSQRRRENAKAKRAAEQTEPSGSVDNKTTGRPLKVCGPSKVQTLRGRLLGREVALICCSEAHEDAVDLTRKGCITEKFEGWLECDCTGLDAKSAWKEKSNLTLEQAKRWAEETLEDAEDEFEGESSDEEDEDEDEDIEKDGAIMVFVPSGATSTKTVKGSAYIFLSGTERNSRRKWPPSAVSFEWGDLDEELREFGRRRKLANDIPVEDHDELIAQRKLARLKEGLELFDDWLARQVGSSPVRLELIMEAPVPANEVELHRDSSIEPLPPAHECLRKIELDSESDSDSDHDGGSDAYIDYLRRRAQLALPKERIHCIDPRELGEGSETTALRESFQALVTTPLPRDKEALELDKLRAKHALPDKKSSENSPAVPSWEAFFGGAADLLYYHPEVKADFTPFLTKCVGSADGLRRFFDCLYFKTIPEAIAELKLDDSTLPFARIRSLAFRSRSGDLLRRPRERPLIPVKAAPINCFLKASGSQPPRTWVSGLAEHVRSAGAEEVVRAARDAFWADVEKLLGNPKDVDKEGDYFEAWLRECHPEIYEDVDTDDPAELRKLDWAPSEKRPNSKKHRHNLKAIRIPAFEPAFEELARFDPDEQVTTRRERVLAKILVDAFQLKLVDLASILKMIDVIIREPEDSRVVIVYFAGGDHTNPVVSFWRSQGFSSTGIPKKGIIGKDDFDDDEPRGLEFPKCLHSLDELFPVPE